MKWHLSLLCLVFILVQSCGNSPASDQNLSVQNPSTTIPFELTDHNNIIIKSLLNGTDSLTLMFHTAASDLSLTSEATADINSIIWDQEFDVKSWGGKSKARYSDSNTLQIESLKWDSLSVWEDTHSGPGTGGKFGPDLFAGKAIEINFDNSQLVIYDSMPEHLEGYSQLPLIIENTRMFIEGVSIINGEEFTNKFLVHSGYSGAILYDDTFTSTSKISQHIEITDEQELKDSYGNVVKTLKGSLPKFVLADLAVENVTVGFFEGTIGRQQMSIMGGGLLKQFNIVIDPNREFIYLSRNQLSA